MSLILTAEMFNNTPINSEILEELLIKNGYVIRKTKYNGVDSIFVVDETTKSSLRVLFKKAKEYTINIANKDVKVLHNQEETFNYINEYFIDLEKIMKKKSIDDKKIKPTKYYKDDNKMYGGKYVGD